jgi:MFS family permease
MMDETEVVQERVPDAVPYSIFTRAQKGLIVTIVSIAATFTSISSNIYFPAIPTIAADLSVSIELLNLTVTSYMIFQGLSPTLWGAVADSYGRRVTYICTFLIYFSACIGLAETKTYYQLVILRCLQSTGSASTIAIGAGVLGDITTREERGGYMGIFQAGLLIPNAAGPIIGGALAGTLGWRAIFWFLVIYCGVFFTVMVLALPETLRSIVGNGSVPVKGVAYVPLPYMRRGQVPKVAILSAEPPAVTSGKVKPHLDLLGPLHILFHRDVTCVIFFLSTFYTVWVMVITAMSPLFASTYGLSSFQIGLTFIANGVGCILGTLLIGRFLDYDYQRIKKEYTGNQGDFPLEHARLRTIWLWSGLQCASTMVFGWTVGNGIHLSVPVICTFIIGWCSTSIQSVVTTFLVDVFPNQSASATAALNFARCLIGACGSAAIIPLTHAIGVGWAFFLCTALMLLSLVLLFIQLHFGGRWRRTRKVKESEIELSNT